MKSYSRQIKKAVDGMTRYFEGVPDQVRRWRLLLWPFFIGMTVLAVLGMERVKFDATIESWFASDDPTLVSLNGFRAQFGSDDNLYIIYRAKDGDVFSAKSLEAAKRIREELITRKLALRDDEASPLRHLVKITALTSAPVLRAEGDALISKHLVVGDVPADRAGLDEIRRIAGTQESFRRLYYSKDAAFGAIMIETDFGTIPADEEPTAEADSAVPAEAAPAIDNLSMDFEETEAVGRTTKFKPTDMAEYYDFMEAIKVTLNKPEYAQHLEYFPVGNPASTEYDKRVLEEMGGLYMAMIAIMIVVLWFLFRSPSGVVWPLSIVVLSCIWVLGFTGWLGYTVSAFMILTVVMILVVGIADTIHVLSGYLYFRNAGHDHRESMRHAFHGAAFAAFLTAITTIIGMLSVVYTPIIPIRVFGVMTSAGIALAFLLTVYWMPLMLDLWRPLRHGPAGPSKPLIPISRLIPNFSRALQRMFAGLLPLVKRYRYAIVTVFGSILIVCMIGGTRVRVDTDVIGQYPPDAPIRESFKIADKEMIGSQSLVIYLDLGSEYAFHDPWVMGRMEALQDTLEQKYAKYVIRTLSLVDVTKKSYQALNEDRPEMQVIPPTTETLSQTLFMFDNSNPVDRRRMVSDDYSKAHVTVYLRNAGSYEYIEVFKQMKRDIDAAVAEMKGRYPGTEASLTGMFMLMMQGSDYISWTSLTSFGSAIICISLLLLLMFGSLKAGLISVISNAVPATLSFGLMGLFDVPMDFNTVLIAPIIVGIAVDDTIHFMTEYQMEVSTDGNVERALRATIEKVGQAVTFSSLILGLGLSVLTLSSSVGNANVGFYGALAIFAGLACELLLLPALILMFDLKFEQADAAGSEHSPESPMAAGTAGSGQA